MPVASFEKEQKSNFRNASADLFLEPVWLLWCASTLSAMVL